MIIGSHAHFTTAPQEVSDWKSQQVNLVEENSHIPSVNDLQISNDDLRKAIEPRRCTLGTNAASTNPTLAPFIYHLSPYRGFPNVP